MKFQNINFTFTNVSMKNVIFYSTRPVFYAENVNVSKLNFIYFYNIQFTNIAIYLKPYFNTFYLSNFFEFDRTITSYNFTKLYIKNFTAPAAKGITTSSEIFSLQCNNTMYFRYISIEDCFLRSNYY